MLAAYRVTMQTIKIAMQAGYRLSACVDAFASRGSMAAQARNMPIKCVTALPGSFIFPFI